MADLNASLQQIGQTVYGQTTDGSTDPTNGVSEDDVPPADDEEPGGTTVEGEFREV